MKTILTIFLTVAMCLCLYSCGTPENNNGIVNTQEEINDVCGTWIVDSIEYEGSSFSVKEWESIEGDDLSDLYIILKDGGKAYLYDDEYGDLVNWLRSDDTIMIGDEKCSIVNGLICIEYYGDKLFLKKSSDSQEVPSQNVDEDESYDDIIYDVDVSESSEETSELSLSDSDWKQFLKEYEEWVDNYIIIVKNYKNNPTDITILSDYMDMISKLSEWTERADDFKYELEDTSEAVEYSKELLRIAGKLAEIEY